MVNELKEEFGHFLCKVELGLAVFPVNKFDADFSDPVSLVFCLKYHFHQDGICVVFKL